MNLKMWILGVSILFLTSGLFYQVIPNTGPAQIVPLLFALFATQSVLLVSLFKITKGLSATKLTQLILVLALGARLLAAFASPILEDDFYRYQWDGHVTSNFVNPYLHAPNSKKLDHLHRDFRLDVGYINVPTIYPPLAQYIFAVNSWIFNSELYGLKIIFVFFDLLTGLILLRWLKLRNIDLRWSLFYFLNPTIIKEVANSVHLDSALSFFFVLAVYSFEKNLIQKTGREAQSFILIALGGLIKLVPLFALPFFIQRSKKPIKMLGLVALTLLLFSLPFVTGSKFMVGLGSFAKHWVINESLFYPISWLATNLTKAFGLDSILWVKKGLLTEMPGKVMVALIYGVITLTLIKRFKDKLDLAKVCLVSVVSLLVLSPVFNPWYTLWFLPFAIICRHPPTIFLSIILVLSYSWYLPPSTYYLIRFVEFAAFFVYLFSWHWSRKKVSTN